MNSQPPPPPPLADPMEFPHTFNDLELSSVWDFDDIFDFTYDGQVNELNPSWSTQSPPLLPLDSTAAPAVDSLAGTSDHGSETASEKIRKRDPRLTCENFLAGRIPCACPELDEMVEEALEEESGRAVKKKPRTAKAVGIVRCQVPACEADISELKGYHKRHRVCLRCVNANEVLLDGEPKRYCQQCGKFHILPDFDEGKRSCRRKLEWHNKRRRRKLKNVRGATGKESKADQPAEDTVFDDKAGKDVSFLSNPSFDDTVESEDGRVSPHDSHPSSQNVQSDSVISFVTSGEGHTNGEKKSSKCTPSSSFGDNKNSYSSMCPTGRISFKLYDWNPAEFPRRLRHQIFQWLGSMPVELEGYIRPGCTILTVFMAMPWFMWDTLSGDASSFIQDFISAPEGLLFGRGPMIVYLNDMVFRVLKGQTSLMNVKVELRAPRLHYVQPTCFEAGQPMEFVVCGSDLVQPKFRFLVSFAGRYIEYDYCLAIPQKRTGMHSGTEEEKTKSCEHQMYKIYIPNTDPELFGPAFVEVENESGISNFIPVLIGDRHLCSEMQIVQQRFYKSICSNGFKYGAHDILSQMCEGLVLRRAAMSELLLDVAWLLKERQLDDIQTFFTSMQIQRFNWLLKFLIQNESTVVLEKILHSLRSFTDVGRLNKLDNETNNSDLKLFLENLEHAREIVQRRYKDVREQVLHSESSLAKEDLSSHNHGKFEMLCVSCTNEDKETVNQDLLGSTTSNFQQSEAIPLINNVVIMNVNHRPPLTKNWQQNTSGHIFSSKIIGSRSFVFIVATAVVCFGACVVVLHPNKVGDFAISIRRSLFGNSNS